VLGLSLGLGSARRAGGGGGIVYDEDAAAYMAAFTVPATTEQANALNDLVLALKDSGGWDARDWISIAGLDEQQFRVNLCDPDQIAVASGSVTFTAGQGMVSAGGYLDTGVTLSALSNYAQDAASIFTWCLSDTNDVNRDCGAAVSANVFIVPRNGGNLQARINAAATSAKTVASSIGLGSCVRQSSGVVEFYKDGASLGTSSSTSSAIPAQNFTICHGANTNSANLIFAAGLGGLTSDDEEAGLNTALAAYKTAIEALAA
jgi:hypothetical protein